ncbi:MAG: histidine--tRNA ligase [Nitrososphaerota archaeon]|nr:histidine--tRNA ligase [Nitrososphaerota archaeon]MDG6932439.1 histidine--tRNA ligase [Nitrososphaerota archaeon]MDG6936049.1 histidine--tRNA ligase [Nitrososphaerota archaeon]MDG6943693.1 histidine--tRNA ligase [Nitrososphaerota archaeon]
MSLPRGLRDYEPENYEKLEMIRSNFVRLSKIYNIRLMEPSTIELLETLQAKGGEDIVNEIYEFTDKGGRRLGLRFDLTVGITRYVCARRDLPLPIKLGSFASMWRYDEPQFGRYRWFYQWDAEVYGDKSAESYTDILSFTSRMLSDAGLRGVQIEISDRRIVEGILKSRISKEEYIPELLRAMDKLGKKTKEQIITEYIAKGIDEESVKEALQISQGGEKLLRESQDQSRVLLENIIDEAKSVNLPLSVNLGIVRGLDYYSDIVFEAYSSEKREIGALAGGGGYDILTNIFKRPDLKALGVAGGTDRLLLALDQAPKENSKITYVVCTAETKKEAIKIVDQLRGAGICTEFSRADRLSDGLRQAEKRGAMVSVLVLPKEIREGKAKIKLMSDRSEELVSVEKLVEKVQATLNSNK